MYHRQSDQEIQVVDQEVPGDQALDIHKTVINPKPAPGFEKSEQIPDRCFFCIKYDLCLDFAIARQWASFTCVECDSFEPETFSPDDVIEDRVRCREIIDAMEEMMGVP
ncbi:MAG: hypothetical protein JSU72_07190 [Deltaproteobacteria bacterium]|nr:MAG: hypothetical protein JSU72_07190 [Deltaproteobacteria bacterium]